MKGGHYDKGELFIAIDPAAFGDPTLFQTAVQAHLAEIKSSKKAPGIEEIRIPGERGFAERRRRLRDGVPVESGVWDQMVALGKQLNVELSSFNTFMPSNA